jgi:hypothetical protein
MDVASFLLGAVVGGVVVFAVGCVLFWFVCHPGATTKEYWDNPVDTKAERRIKEGEDE